MVTSGGLGTMGFGLPAAIGATFGAPHRKVCVFMGDGGIQMNIQELGTVMEQNAPVKIIVLKIFLNDLDKKNYVMKFQQKNYDLFKS